MVLVGDPQEIAERIIDLHHHFGHRRRRRPRKRCRLLAW